MPQLLPLHLDHLEPGEVWQRLVDLCGCSQASLAATTVHPFAPVLLLQAADEPPEQTCDSKTILRYFRAAAGTYCPRCLDEDPPYERLLWSFRPLSICTVHHCWLQQRCPACHSMLRPARLDLRRCRCGHLLTEVSSDIAPEQVRQLTQQIENGTRGDVTFSLLGMTVAATFWWLERLAVAVSKKPIWIGKSRQRFQIDEDLEVPSVAWLAASALLVEWPVRFEEFLDVFQTVTKHRTSETGVSRAFGTLLRSAAKLEELGFSLPADTLRTYLLARFRRGHLSAKVCLFQGDHQTWLTSERPWLTQTDAVRQLHLRHGLIPELLARGLLVGETHKAGDNGRSIGLVSRESVDALQRQLNTSVTAPEAAQRLGIGRHRVLEMIPAELLPRSLRTAKGWLIPQTSVVRWERFVHDLPVVSPETSAWLSLHSATRRWGRSGLTLMRLLQLVDSRQVRAARKVSTKVLGELVVNTVDLESCRHDFEQMQHEEQGYSLNRLTRELIPGRPLKDVVLRKWMAAGFLLPTEVNGVRRIPAEEVQRFRATYCLADAVCEQLGIVRSTLSRWEAAATIVAVYGRRTHPGAGASLFLREDVERLRSDSSSLEAPACCEHDQTQTVDVSERSDGLMGQAA